MTRAKIELLACAALLALIFVLSLVLRVAVPWDHVFSGQWVKFTDNDPYFYARLLDNLSAHFPLLGSFDPYFAFPGGKDLTGQPLFFVYFMGFFAWLFGGGAPSQHTVDTVAALFPAVLGALLVFPVFFSARAIFNKWAGLAAALFIALLPGEFLARTLLGDTDSHVMEIFFSTLFMMCVLFAVRAGRPLALTPLLKVDRRRLAETIAWSAAAGLCLGVYLLSWQGALFFVLISFAWLVIQVASDHLRRIASGYLGLSGAIFFAIALLVTLSSPLNSMIPVSLAVAVLGSAALPLISHFMSRKQLNPAYYVLAVVALAVAGILGLSIVMPQILRGAASAMAGFFSWNPASTIAESQPLLISQGAFTLAMVWGNYTSASIMSLVALAIVIYLAVRRGTPEFVMLAVWSVLTLLAALALRRFAYYFAINAAVLAGYTGWLILRACGFSEEPAVPQPAPPTQAAKKRAKARRARAGAKQQGAANPAIMALGAAAVALLAIYPNTGPLPGGDRPFYDVSTRALNAPSNAWMESLDWMRNNTPQPFGDAQYYFKYYGAGPSRASQASPAPAYGVLCWWDYGYWVSRVAQRVPFSNPGTAQQGEEYYFMAQSPGEKAAEPPSGIKYVVVNDYLADWSGGFETVASDAGRGASGYYEVYYRSSAGKLAPTLLYYPEYYKTMAVRLYCFDGKPFTPAESAVVSWENRTGADGRPYKEITGLKAFRTYAEAADFTAAEKGSNVRIVGKDPNVSPVPLEELSGYRLAYGSSRKVKIGTADTPEVKVFEYSK